jgi:cyclophilin family peptidyl-prolyl cis-trans isomerase
LEVSHYVYLTIKLNKDEIGYIKIDLYESIVPKTVMNFLTICKGVKFSQKNEDLLMSYTNVRIHKVRPGHLLETGDFLYHSGYGHESIYGP